MINQEIQKLAPSALVTVYVLDATLQGGDINYFHAGTNQLVQPVVWQGQTYTPYPVEARGFEKSAKGTAPRPSLRVANIGGVIGAMCTAHEDLIGAKLIRKRTFQRFLDEVNFPSSFGPSGVNVEFTRSSTASYMDADGVIQTAAANVPRFDHDPVTHAPRGLLTEPSRTNLLTYSSEFDNAAWLKARSTVTPNATVAPDSATTADLWLENATVGASYIYKASFTFTAGNTYTLSVFAKYHKDQRLNLALPSGNGFAVGVATIFNLQTGQVTGSGGVMTDVGGGWYRCSITGVCTTTTTANWIALSLAESLSDATSGLYLWGAQLEVASSVSSYIPTTTADVTRAADVASMTGTNFSDWFNQAEGTFVHTAVSTSPDVDQTIFCVDDGGSTQADQFDLRVSGGVQYRFRTRSGAVSTAELNPLAFALGSRNTGAWGYAVDNYGASINGSAVVTDTSGALPGITMERLQLGDRGSSGGTDKLSGYIERVTYYATRLSDADLQTLSAGGSITTQPTMSLDFTTGSLEVNQWGYYNPEADPNAHFPDDVFFVNRKAEENAVFVEFELASALDVHGVKLPRGVVIQNTCRWQYRSPQCGYAGGAKADINDVPTLILAEDQCSKRLSGCELRFGVYAALPYGSFPGAGLNRGI